MAVVTTGQREESGAAPQGDAALESVSRHVQGLPSAGILLLDGFCHYSGPGIVFETDWDFTGPLQVNFQNSSIVGDVISPTTQFTDAGIDTTIYGMPEGHYPHGSNLFVYNVENATLVQLGSKQAALDYFKLVDPKKQRMSPC